MASVKESHGTSQARQVCEWLPMRHSCSTRMRGGSRGRQAKSSSLKKKRISWDVAQQESCLASCTSDVWCPSFCHSLHGSLGHTPAVARSFKRRLWEADGNVLELCLLRILEVDDHTAHVSLNGAHSPPTCSKNFNWLRVPCPCACAISEPAASWLWPAMHLKACVAHQRFLREAAKLCRQG